MTSALVAGLLAVAVLAGWARLGRWQAGASIRSRWWRIALLAVGQPAIAALLYLTLFPPVSVADGPATLTVLTRGARGGDGGAVALPESGRAGGEQAPDLATALRRHPATSRLRIVGEGLEARDRDAARPLAIAFDPPPPPRGLVALAPPAGPVAPGAALAIGGEAAGLEGGEAALVDPAGQEVSRTRLRRDGGFTLAGAARTAGAALFRVRLRDARGRSVEEADAPVWVAASTPSRVLFLAGAPGPEVKFWRRWATDAGLAVTLSVAVGAGLDLGGPRPSITAASLGTYDLVIVDERSWVALGERERAALAAAARGGAGLLLRVTGPLPDGVRRAWGALGLPLTAATATVPVGVSPADGGAPAPSLRLALPAGTTAVSAARDAAGQVIAAWRQTGLGRVGVWMPADASSLVTAGDGARFGEWWAATVAALARPHAVGSPLAPAMAGQRVTFCRVPPHSRVVDASGSAALLTDPSARGCAGFWPTQSGWHLLRLPDGDRPFYVYPADMPAGVRAAERRDATLALVRSSSAAPENAVARPGHAASPWGWFVPMLLAMTLLWVLERSRAGRGPASG